MMAQKLSYAMRRGFEITEVRRAAFTGRRTHGDEDYLRVRNGIRITSAEQQIRTGLGDQLLQARFINGDATALQLGNFLLVGVDACYAMPEKRQASAGGKTHISSPNDGYIHSCFRLFLILSIVNIPCRINER